MQSYGCIQTFCIPTTTNFSDIGFEKKKLQKKSHSQGHQTKVQTKINSLEQYTNINLC